MDINQSTTLNKILTEDEFNKTPDDVKQKLEIYFTQRYEDFLTSKAIAETAKTNYDEAHLNFDRQVTDFTSQIQDLELKLGNSQQSVDELRKYLNDVIAEKDHLSEKTNQYEAELIETRRSKNFIIDERDSLLKMVERQTSEIERIQTELKMSQTQLKSAINAKCEAIARIDEVQSKETAIEFKEKRMEQERNVYNNQIQTLTEDLNRNISELQTIRRDHTLRYLQLETKLTEKSEELKIVLQENANFKESNESLSAKAHELSTKLFKQCEEANHMISFYKKELQAKTKLSELYKMTNDDRASEANELEAAVCELKRMLSEASEQYGDLETKLKSMELKHQQELDEKDKVLQAQNDQLIHANQLLKEVQNESLENAVGKLAPSAAVANRLMKADMSLTELYSLYVKTTEECEFQKRENGKLNLQIKTILQELEERAPIMKKQELDYQKLIEANNELTQQLENIIIEKSQNSSDLKEAQIKIGQLERENKKLKLSQNDLGRQVCYLLKEMEQIRCGFINEGNNDTIDMSTDEVISKKLVTFSSLAELQENNQKLLLLVRDLSSKLEELEAIQQSVDEASYQSKIDTLSKRLLSMQESFEDQKKVLNTYMAKCERLKRMCSDLFLNENSSKRKLDQIDVSDNEIDATVSDNKTVVDTEKREDKRIKELETLVQEQKIQLNKMKTEYEEYILEKKKNEKIMNEQFDSMRTEVRDITSNNCKLLSTIEYNSEQIKLQQKNIDTYKKQISALEERKKNYENTIVKHEHTLLYLKDEVMNSQKKLVSSEIQVENLKQECRLLKDTESRLQVERESLLRERQTQSLLLNNLEMIKASFERSETEGRIRLETRLDEANRELSALRRRLQEEQDHFRELASELGRQTERATERMEEEIKISDKLHNEIQIAREEINLKSKQIEELSRKLQDSLTPNKNDNPIALANKKARDIQIKYEEAILEIQSLYNELEKTKEHANQYCKMSESAEKELKELYDMHTQYTANVEKDLETLRLSESSLKAHVAELETEIQLQITTAQISNEKYPSDIQKIQEELKDTLQKLSNANREIRLLREQNSTLSANLNNVEQKYANEMMLHSSDIQEMANFKEELNKIKQQHNDLKSTKENAIVMYEENKKKWEELEKMFNNEKEELTKRLTDLDSQNCFLHEQLQSLTAKQMVYMDEQKLTDTSMSSDLNRSTVEDECQGNEKLLQIIKFLRKEKQIAVAKVDILKSENTRLMSEQTIAQKKIDELNAFLNEERTKTETEVVTASRHEEILRKIETLNAITDSNRVLREERDSLSNRVKELVEQVSKIEDLLFPVQEKNRELNSKIEQLNAENCSLRTETGKWRQRANNLIDKSNKNPEEFKRLQTERENLAKMLTVEKDNIQKVNEELAALKVVKANLDSEVLNLQKQLHLSNEDKKKLADEYNVLKAQNVHLLNEITEYKNKVLQNEEQLKKLKTELDSKDAQFLDTKKKEIQIRKIAKRYKDSFFELKNKESSVDEGPTVGESGDHLSGVPPSDKIENDKSIKDKINELNALIASSQEENEKLKKEIEELKSSSDKEGRGKILLMESKSKILSLTQANNSIAQELATTKTNLEILKKNCEEHEAIVNSIKLQYEDTISKMAKDQGESEQSKETISRLTRENENLLMRVNQVNRQLGLQQVSKPSTSSGVVSDKGAIESPRTANVKPMSGTSVQQSATVTPWRGSETPLASIRPITVQNSRTAAVLPTSQTANINVMQGSTGGMTALVPPQQQVHTTANNIESMSSPTSSHTDYMPATSSAAIVVAAVPPMGSSTAESTQEAESITSQNDSPVTLPGGQQQTVALVSPRIEGTQNVVPPPQAESQQEPNIQPSTSGTSSSTSHISISSHHHASSSNNVTTTQAVGNKRPRDNEGDSSLSNEDCVDKTSPLNKRSRQHLGVPAESQGSVTESGLEVEYQVPTSSQRDQEYDIVIVDSEEDDGMSDEGIVENEDGPVEDQENDGYEESYDQNQDLDDGDGPSIDENNVQPDNSEVEINDSNEAPVQRGSEIISAASTSSQQPTVDDQNQDNNQQIQTISSGSGDADNVAQTSTWRQSTPLSRQQQATLIRLQKGCNEEVGCDSIVPSGSSTEAQSHGSGIRKIAESTRSETPQDTNEKVDENVTADRNDGDEEYTDETPASKAENLEDKIEPESVEEMQHDEEVVEEGVSTDEKSTNEIISVDFDNSGPSQSLAIEGPLEEDVGIDGVTSEGEKTVTDGEVIEEGREAEASTSLNITTRSKVFRGNQSIRRSDRSHSRGGRPTPIIWQDQMGNQNNRGHDLNNPSRNFQGQRGQRARRNRRPTGPVYGNPRY